MNCMCGLEPSVCFMLGPFASSCYVSGQGKQDLEKQRPCMICPGKAQAFGCETLDIYDIIAFVSQVPQMRKKRIKSLI